MGHGASSIAALIIAAVIVLAALGALVKLVNGKCETLPDNRTSGLSESSGDGVSEGGDPELQELVEAEIVVSVT